MSPALQSVPFSVETVRRDFAFLDVRLAGDLPIVFLDNAASTQVPRQVLDCFTQTYGTGYANVHRGVHYLSERATALYEAAREKVRAFLNAADPAEIIFTAGTTDSINLVANSWGTFLQPGDEILLSEMEHHSNLVPWLQVASRTGAVVRYLPLTADGQLDRTAWPEFFTPKVKVLAITAVSNVLGTVNPLPELIALAQGLGAVVLVDAAQSVPHLPTDVQQLGADFVAFSAHKMLGVGGVGVLYGRRDRLEAMPPYRGGGSMIRRVQWDGFTPADLPAKFEAGTPPIVPAIALGAAIDYLQALTLPAIARHEHDLVTQAWNGLSALPFVRLLGPSPDRRAGLLSFTILGTSGREIHAHDVASLLNEQGIAVRAGHHCTMPLHKKLGVRASARASFYVYNTTAEVAQFVSAVENLPHSMERSKGLS